VCIAKSIEDVDAEFAHFALPPIFVRAKDLERFVQRFFWMTLWKCGATHVSALWFIRTNGRAYLFRKPVILGLLPTHIAHPNRRDPFPASSTIDHHADASEYCIK